MINNEITNLLSSKGLKLMGGEIIMPTRTIDAKPDLLSLEHSIIRDIRARGAGGTELNQQGIEFVLGLGIGSICVIKDPKKYVAFGVVHPDSSYKEGRLVIAQIGKHTDSGFWTPDHLNPAKPDLLNLNELISTCSAISQLATVGDHDKAGFAGIADPRHLSSVMSTVIEGSQVAKMIGLGGADRQIHIADEWEKYRSMASIITQGSPDDLALIPIPITVRKAIYETAPQPDLAAIFPRYLVDQDDLDTKAKLSPLSATQTGALELLQVMAITQQLLCACVAHSSPVADSFLSAPFSPSYDMSYAFSEISPQSTFSHEGHEHCSCGGHYKEGKCENCGSLKHND